MPVIFPVGSNALTAIRRLAAVGDDYAEAIVALWNNTYYAALTPGAEAGGGAAANSIRVAGQIKDQDGQNVPGIKNVLITSKPVSGAGTITDGGAGAVVAGSASTNCWMTTDANGAFVFDVLNAAAEVNLVMVDIDGGTTEMLTLTFAA
jgi:hypothetical protein